MVNDIQEIIVSKEQIQTRVAELGKMISKDYAGKNPLIVGILKGSFIFMADLVREISEPCEIEFMSVSSYGSGTETSGKVKISKDISRDVEGRHIIFVEDILDTGITLNYVIGHMGTRNPASMKICTLLNKPERRIAPITAQYIGFEIPNSFAVGYGLDYDQKYRNLPFIGVLKPEIYSK